MGTPLRQELLETNSNGRGGDRWITIEQGTLSSAFWGACLLTTTDGKIVIEKHVFDMTLEEHKDEPQRPTRPMDQKVVCGSARVDLSKCYTWIEWAGQRMTELKKKSIEKDMEFATKRKNYADELASQCEEHKQQVANVHMGFKAAMTKDIQKKTQELATENALIEKRKEELKVTEAVVKRMEAKSTSYQDLCEAITTIGDKVNKAVQDMRNLTVRKSTPQSAFTKWESRHIGPILQLMELERHVKAERDEMHHMHTERMNALQARESASRGAPLP